ALPIPPKLNINKHIVIASFLGLMIFLSLVCVSYLFKIEQSKLTYAVISIIISMSYLISIYFINNRKRNYIHQWNMEVNYFFQEKLKLKKRTVDAKVNFIMTSLGEYGNSDFAKNHNSILKFDQENKNGVLKNAKLLLFNEDDDIVRFKKIIEYFLSSNLYYILNKYKTNNIRLLFIDNLSTIEKEIILNKIKDLNGSLIDNFSFIQSENISQLLNDLANRNSLEHFFLFGLNINKNIEKSGEVAIVIEFKSNLNKESVKIHQSPVIKDDCNLESIINFGNCTSNEIENIWYTGLSNLDLSEVSSFFKEVDKDFEPKLINIDTVFGITGELSELLLMVLAIEQANRSKQPQLIINSSKKNTARIISNY
ncbi:TPA: hypothetical protein SMT55_003628, partial [Proteus mirabilis]|nr:hypothetical protein [Proteus mirabilis]HEK2725916.1 hypothetical protein [Proteus mirabilis]